MKVSARRHTCRLFYLPALLWFCASLSYGAANYVASIIEFGEQVQAVNSADLNGDSLNDLIVSNWNEDYGRELWVFLQQAGGKFPAKPSQRIEVKRDIIAYALADIRSEPGEELLFFTALSIFSYSTSHDSYAGNLQKLSDWEFVNAVPSRRSTPLLGHFKKNSTDGRVELLIPGKEIYGILHVSPADSDTAPSVKLIHLPKAQHRRQQPDNEEGGVSVSFQDGFTVEVNRPSYLQGLFVERLQSNIDDDEDNEFARYADQGLLLNLERWINSVSTAQLLPGPELEYIYFDEDPDLDLDSNTEKPQRLNIVSITNANKANLVGQYSFKKRDGIRLFDFNDDGLMDIMATQRQGAEATVANFYLNRQGKFNFDKADQVFKVDGNDVRFELSDVNGDGRSDLIVGAYQISPLQALRGGAITRISLIFRGLAIDNAELFNKRPDFKLEESFSVDDIKGLTSAVDYTVDLDGDANKDAIALDKRGALTARKMDRDFRLDSNIHWEFVPNHFIQAVDKHTLNKDSNPDFVLRHQNSITVLVSQ